MSLSRFESMLKTNDVYFFDAADFEDIIQHYLNIGKHALAKKALQLGLAQHPYSIPLKLLKVEVLIFEHHLESATALINEIELVDPYNDELFFQKAIILSKHKKHHDAIVVLNELLNHVDDPLDVWALLGMEYLYLDDFENARLNFTKCINVDFEDYAALDNIIYCYEMQGSFKQSIKFLKGYINRNPYSEVAWHQLGKQYFELQDYQSAIEAFDYAILIDDAFVGGYLEKAKSLEHLGHFEAAIENYMVSLELDDPTAFAYLRIGECYQKLKITGVAIDFYEKALYEDPLLDKAWFLLGNLFYESEHFEKAIYALEKAIQIDDTNPNYWKKYAEIHRCLNHLDVSLKAYQQCITMGTVDIEVDLGLIDVFIDLGQFNNALAYLLKSKDRYIESTDMECRLFGVFMHLNNEQKAYMHLRIALKGDLDALSKIQNIFPDIAQKKQFQNFVFEILNEE